MPYFPFVDLLYIHVPKTGGSSIEEYFYTKGKKYKIKRDERTLYGGFFNTFEKKTVPNQRSLQHFTYREMLENAQLFERTLNKRNGYIKIIPARIVLQTLQFKQVIVSVRNPFDRCLSEMCYRKRINVTFSKEDIEKEIAVFLAEPGNGMDNHKLPQYQFILDAAGVPIQNIHIVKTETLISDMQTLGFKDFHLHENKSDRPINYRELLTENAAKLIAEYYATDFSYFGYSTDPNVGITLARSRYPNIKRFSSFVL
jgi:hypothetical protein